MYVRTRTLESHSRLTHDVKRSEEHIEDRRERSRDRLSRYRFYSSSVDFRTSLEKTRLSGAWEVIIRLVRSPKISPNFTRGRDEQQDRK
jgi:hypothetical protein